MRSNPFKISMFFTLTLITVSLLSCKKDLMTMEKDPNADLSTASSSVIKAVPADLPGRALASNCFQCHGTNGHAGELKIAGQGKSGILDAIRGMKSRSPGSNIMNVHAQGYTEREMELIADFISKQ